MAVVICMDGLGGHPNVTFGPLREALSKKGHKTVIVGIENIETHEDRVKKVLAAFDKARREYPSERIVLVGQSAGGSAVRIAAERLSGENALAGVTMLSPAMPRFVWFATKQLFRVMSGRLLDIILGRTLYSEPWEFEALVSPLPADLRKTVISNRQPVPGKEARTLALFPPRFRGYRFPTLLVHGERDQWVAPRAQEALASMLEKSGSKVTHVVVRNSGHITLASVNRQEVAASIALWIEKMCE